MDKKVNAVITFYKTMDSKKLFENIEELKTINDQISCLEQLLRKLDNVEIANRCAEGQEEYKQVKKIMQDYDFEDDPSAQKQVNDLFLDQAHGIH